MMSLRKHIAQAASRIPTLLRDGAGLLGVVLVSAGAWQVYHPAGLIVGGLQLIVGAIAVARAA